MSYQKILPAQAQKLLDEGAMLVDVRANDEYVREHIAQARHMPMEQLSRHCLEGSAATAVIFHCKSGNRTLMQAESLAECASRDVYVLDGGMDAWKRSGLPTVIDASQPMELSRQVHIAAGLLVLLGVILGTVVSPWFYILSGFVGAGLVFAGLSGFCGMARVLMKAPWNRRAGLS
ncbi:DUF2892 domain-containing protein [Allopusillimonas ginsengisoli]|nr:DUF2892 domain-containing protein [Allopusillimonas ginsengisoli]